MAPMRRRKYITQTKLSKQSECDVQNTLRNKMQWNWILCADRKQTALKSHGKHL